MKHTGLATLIAASLLVATACTSLNNREDRQARAAATCIEKETEAERKTCMDTELAAMTALEREEQLEHQREVSESERREAIRQAYGVPKDQARDRYNSGLGLPGGPQ